MNRRGSSSRDATPLRGCARGPAPACSQRNETLLRHAALAVASALIATACGGAAGAPIERTVGGETRLGAFVGPHSYEHFVRGELAREAGELERAAEHYELARAGAVDDPLLLARIAEVRDSLGNSAAAERALEEGARLDPRSEAIWMARGRIAERHSNLDAAIESYVRAADASEGSEEPVIALARVLRESGAGERADAVLERFLSELDEGGRAGGVGVARARLSLALARGDARAAGLAALELARRSPSHGDEVARAAIEVLDAGHPTLAHRLLSLLPEGTVSPSLRLRVALAAGERSEAEALLATARPDTPDELTTIANAWLALGDANQAAELAEVALARGGGGGARVALARARLEQGRLAEAAALAAGVPAGSSGRDEARATIADALARAGRPALAAEVRAAAAAAAP